MPPYDVLLLLGAAVLVGSLVQSSAGMGLGLLVTPLLALVAPDLVPGTILLLSWVLPLLILRREWRAVDRRTLGWTLLGRVPGSVAGAAVVVLAGAEGIAVAVAVAVLVSVALSVAPARVTAWMRPTRPALVVGGAIGGVGGSTSSISGPPVALLLQRERGPVLRATLNAYFALGHVVSMAALAVAGELGLTQLLAALALLPALLVGDALAGPLRRVLDGGWTRPAVLGLCTASSLALLARTVL